MKSGGFVDKGFVDRRNPCPRNPVHEILRLSTKSSNDAYYSAFFLAAGLQARTLAPTMPEEANLLKRIDEFNYCKHTKGWM
jgi:hypothetical protein